MGIFSWLFGSGGSSPAGDLWIKGYGDYDYDIVGESFYQDALDMICGGKCEEGHEKECVALLVPEPNNPHDANAVAVKIDHRKVGHLNRREAAAFRSLLHSNGFRDAQVRCRALILGGWNRGHRGEGHYGVKLDIPDEIELVQR